MPNDPADTTNDLLKELVELTGKVADTQKAMLAVARFGPSAGVAGGTPTRKDPTPEERAQKLFQDRQSWMRERGGAFQQIGMTSAGSAYHRAASMAEGFQGLGMGRMAGLAQRAALPMAVAGTVGSAMNTASHVANIVQDPFMSRRGMDRALFRMLPGGETLQKFNDAMSGRQGNLQRIDLAYRKANIDLSERATFNRWELGQGAMQAGRQAVADTYGNQLWTGKAFDTFHPAVDRSSARGEVMAQNQMKMIPFRKEMLRTERDLAKASSERLRYEEKAVETSKVLKSNEAERNKIGKEIDRARRDPNTSTEQLQTLYRRHELLTNAVQQSGAQARAAEESAAAARAGEAQARGAHGATQARMKRGEADVKQGEADRSMGTARTLGEMDPIQRQQGMNVLKMLQSGANPDLLPPEMKSLARQVAPAEYDKIVTQHGAQTETFKAGQQAGLVGFDGEPFKLQGEADQLRREADQGEYQADSQAAEQVAKAGADLANTVGALVRRMIETAQRELENQLRLGANSQ